MLRLVDLLNDQRLIIEIRAPVQPIGVLDIGVKSKAEVLFTGQGVPNLLKERRRNLKDEFVFEERNILARISVFLAEINELVLSHRHKKTTPN